MDFSSFDVLVFPYSNDKSIFPFIGKKNLIDYEFFEKVYTYAKNEKKSEICPFICQKSCCTLLNKIFKNT